MTNAPAGPVKRSLKQDEPGGTAPPAGAGSPTLQERLRDFEQHQQGLSDQYGAEVLHRAATALDELARALADTRERLDVAERHITACSRYQPKYNGRPSCPFCAEFIDNESTHDGDCIVVKIRARALLKGTS